MARLILCGALVAIVLVNTPNITHIGRAGISAEAESHFSAAAVPVFAETHFVRQVPIVMKDVVFERNTGKFYASVPSRAGAMGNSIARIDAATGAIEGFVFVGSEPGKLALADDGNTLYVSLDGAAAVRKYDITTQTAGAQFALGETQFNGPFFVNDLAVAPGNPNVVAVSRKNLTSSPDFEGVAVYDNGLQRSLTTPRHTGSDFVAFSNSGSTLYGAGSAGIQRMSVTSAGITVVNTTPTSAANGDFKFDNGFLYLPFGQVFNAPSLLLAGTFNVGGPGALQLEPDSSVGRVYFLTGSNAFNDTDPRTLTIQVFDQNTFVPLGTLDIPNVRGQVTSLVRWGANGLAFGSTGGQFYIIQTTLVPSSEPVPTPTPTPSPPPTPSPSPTPTPGPGQLREVQIVAKDLVVDPSGTLFVSVPSSAGASGNTITTIDPVSNVVGQSVFVGSEPNKLAITDNGQFIYVGLDGAKSVRRFDVAARTSGLQFAVDPQGQFVAVDLAAAPGQPQTVAAARGSNPNASDGGAAVYDDGVQRGNTVGIFHKTSVIEFSASPLILYGHNNADSEAGFRRMAAASCGLSVLSVKGALLSGAANFKIEDGRAFATSGRVADPEAGTLIGTYPVTADVQIGTFPTAVIADSAANRVYFFMNDAGADFFPATMLVRAFDMQTFLHVGTTALPAISGRPTAAVRWGADGFAFRTSTNKVYLIQTSLIPSQTQPPVPAPTPPPPTYTLRGQVSSSVAPPFGPPLPTVTLQLSGGPNGTTTTNADGSFAFIGLPLCTSFTLTPAPLENYTFSPSSRTITPADQNNPNQSNMFFSAIPRLVGFSSTSVDVSEGTNSVNVIVVRQGDVSVPATVNYQTINGTASDRSDYTAAIGTLRFAANQTAKLITILLTDDVRDEPNETLTVSLSDPMGALLAPATATITITDNDPADGTNNPADSPQFFVRQHYLDFLNRDPDPDGLGFWINEITSCGADAQCVEVKRINVSAAFFLSIEFQETGYLAYRAHKVAYGDTTSPNVQGTVPLVRFREFLADAQRIGEGVRVGIGNWQQQLESNKSDYVLEFVQRSRFIAAYPLTMTADEFVSRLDQNAGSVLSVAEKSQLVTLLVGSPGDATKRAAVLRAVADDADLRAGELNRAFVLMQYYGYMRRNPDDPQDVDFTGWKFWLDKLNQFNGNFIQAEMVKAFITATEYRQRFGP